MKLKIILLNLLIFNLYSGEHETNISICQCLMICYAMVNSIHSSFTTDEINKNCLVQYQAMFPESESFFPEFNMQGFNAGEFNCDDIEDFLQKCPQKFRLAYLKNKSINGLKKIKEQKCKKEKLD